MTWLSFKQTVNDLLGVERRRLGAQPFIDLKLRFGVGDVQRLIDYYRKGVVTTLDADDMIREGFASKAKMPQGAMLKEMSHVKTGNPSVHRPLYPIDWSNRHELVAGYVGIGRSGGWFRYALNTSDGARDLYVYPAVTKGYAVRIVWDALVGRGTGIEYSDTDETPLDESVASAVHLYIKMELSREVDRDLQLAREYERSYRQAIASLHSEVQERLRLRRSKSQADCAPSCGQSDGVTHLDNVIPESGVIRPEDALACGTCQQQEKPTIEWVMFGDSGELATINDTVSVATAVKAQNPDFVIHMGDAAYPHGGMLGGSDPIVRDLFTKHYWNFIQAGAMYFSWGNHDLEDSYGSRFLDVMPNVADLIGSQKSQGKYWYEFAKGQVRFFVLHSGQDDSDASNFVEMRTWLQQRACAAKEKWLVCVYHRPAYTSDASHNPGSMLMRGLWLHEIGIDLAVNAHAHNYERVLDPGGLMHVICGLGGATKREKATSNLPPGSQAFYNQKNGFLRFSATEESMQFEMVTVDGEVVDRVTLEKDWDGNPRCYGYVQQP